MRATSFIAERLVQPLFCFCAISSNGIIAAFLYCAGYREMISFANDRFAALNAKGICEAGELVSSLR